MREYESREAAENDPELNLRYLYKCEGCGDKIEEYPNYIVRCQCGGEVVRIGEVYNA